MERYGVTVDIKNSPILDPEVDAAIQLTLPDEKFRRVGQSMAAASLPASK